MHAQALLKEVRIKPQIQQIEGHIYFRCIQTSFQNSLGANARELALVRNYRQSCP